jgi:imidazolonepropionase-like amidohydrolase
MLILKMILAIENILLTYRGRSVMNNLLLKGGIVYNVESGKYDESDILIEERKIKQISKNISYDDKKTAVLDVSGKYILPGLIDCHTHIGIIEEGTGKLGIDNNEKSDPVTPHLRAIDGINPFDRAFTDAYRSGITTVMSGPGSSNAIGGLNGVFKTYGTIIDRMVLKNPSGLKIAFGEEPINTYGKNDKCPVTRMGTASLIRETFMRAQDYMVQKENGKIIERNIKLEALIPVLKGQILLRAHAHRADDIITAIRIADEFNIKNLVIEHGTEAYLIKDFIKERKIPIAFGPILTPRIKMELNGRNYAAVLELNEAGVKIAIVTDHPYITIDQLRSVTALAVSEGMSEADAIKCITLHPAEMLRCEDRIGRIKEGLDADLAVYDGKPLDIMSKVRFTIIEGKIVYDAKKELKSK